MPYPDANAYAITTPSTRLEEPSTHTPSGGNSLGGDYIGNAHTFRVTANDAGQIAGIMPPYDYREVPVVFDGSNDYLANPTNLGLASSGRLTACVRVFISSLTGHATLIGMTTASVPGDLIGVTASRAISIRTPTDFSTVGLFGETPAGVVPLNQWVTIHLVVESDINAKFNLYMNGARIAYGNTTIQGGPPVGMFSFTTFDSSPPNNLPAATAWSVGATPLGTNKLNGKMAFAWMDVGQAITDPRKFFPSYNMGPQLASPGARPAIGFGGVQTVADWNAGTNLGDGTGTWTMNGAVTAG